MKNTIAAIFGAAVLLRLSGLLTGSIWYDEAFSLYMARLPFFEMIRYQAQDYNPPLWDSLVWIVSRLGAGMYAGRLLALLGGLACLWLVWLLIQEFDFSDSQQIAAALGLLLPYGAWIAQDGRSYSIFAALYLAGALFAIRGRLAGLAACCGLLMYCHTVGIFYSWALLLAALLYSPARRVIVAGALAGLAYLPWLPALLWQAQHSGQHWLDNLNLVDLIEDLQIVFFAGALSGNALKAFSALLLAWAIGLAAVAAAWSVVRPWLDWLNHWIINTAWQSMDDAERQNLLPQVGHLVGRPTPAARLDRQSLALLIIALGPLVILLVVANWQNMIYYRPLSGLLYPLVLLLAARLPPGKNPYRWLLAGVWLLLLAGSLVGWSPESRGAYIQQAAASIAAARQPGDLIYHVTPTTYLPFSLYLPGQALYPLPEDTSYGLLSYHLQQAFELPRLPLDQARYSRIWIIYARDRLIPASVTADLAPLIARSSLVAVLPGLQFAPIEIYLYAQP